MKSLAYFLFTRKRDEWRIEMHLLLEYRIAKNGTLPCFPVVIFLPILTLTMYFSLSSRAFSDFDTTFTRMHAAKDILIQMCEKIDCMNIQQITDNEEKKKYKTKDFAAEAIAELIEAWAEGVKNRESGLVPQEVPPTNKLELNRLVGYLQGRWVGVTTWGNHDDLGEIEGVKVDLTLRYSGNSFVQQTVHPDLGCVSSGAYRVVARGGLRFANLKEQGDCRDMEVGIRAMNDGTIKWTRFVGEWPVAWGFLLPVPE